MAVAPTGAIYKALEFDNVSSRTYGVYITGEAVYNAPQRDVEMITIPGRSGSFALDNGRFENIEVSYPAGIFADTEADFRQAISDFRNFLCSRKGYVRLQDEYNPNEYRMAVYKSGLDVDPALLRAGEFTITFDCKPQRWLTSGETAVAYSNNDTITNPTLFDAEPLLAVKGSGTISFNSYNIELNNNAFGNVVFFEAGQSPHIVSMQETFPSIANNGDQITIASVKFSSTSSDILTFSSATPTGSDFNYNYYISNDGKSAYIEMTDIVFLVGTASTKKYEISVHENGSVASFNFGSITLAYDGNNTVSLRTGTGLTNPTTRTTKWSDFIVHSTKVIISGTIYIDCELGEAYKIEGADVVSLNQYIDLGSDLPKLAPGSNTVTYNNTVTELKITPRWWKV